MALNRAFGLVQRGARLVAMRRNLYWRTDEGLQLGTGAFLVGLEKAARVEAEITGKPSAAFFEAAPAHVGGGESDVLAAQRAGLTVALVKTGKYLPENRGSAHAGAGVEGAGSAVVLHTAELPFCSLLVHLFLTYRMPAGQNGRRFAT